MFHFSAIKSLHTSERNIDKYIFPFKFWINILIQEICIFHFSPYSFSHLSRKSQYQRFLFPQPRNKNKILSCCQGLKWFQYDSYHMLVPCWHKILFSYITLKFVPKILGLKFCPLGQKVTHWMKLLLWKQIYVSRTLLKYFFFHFLKIWVELYKKK